MRSLHRTEIPGTIRRLAAVPAWLHHSASDLLQRAHRSKAGGEIMGTEQQTETTVMHWVSVVGRCLNPKKNKELGYPNRQHNTKARQHFVNHKHFTKN
ncbi:hypothetical protein AAC387_Pa12g0873 [Persea americana]